MSPQVQARVEAVLGAPARIEPAVCANRQGGVVSGGTTCIREQARAQGLSQRELADRVGVSATFMSPGGACPPEHGPPGPGQGEAALESPARVESAPGSHGGHQGAVGPDGGPRSLAERDGAAGGHQSLHALPDHERPAHPVGAGARDLHAVLFRPSAAELVVPAEVKVMAWKKGGRNGVVVRGAGGPGGQSIRTGGRVPWGAEVEYAYRAGYDSRGRLSVTHLVDEKGYSVMLNKPDPESACSSVARMPQ